MNSTELKRLTSEAQAADSTRRNVIANAIERAAKNYEQLAWGAHLLEAASLIRQIEDCRSDPHDVDMYHASINMLATDRWNASHDDQI